MANEIEFKVKINGFDEFKKIIDKVKDLLGEYDCCIIQLKEDWVYNKDNKFGPGSIARLRRSVTYSPIDFTAENLFSLYNKINNDTNKIDADIIDDSFYLTTKYRKTENGNEINTEYEEEISEKVFTLINTSFNVLGHEHFWHKYKISYLIPTILFVKDYHFELVSVNGNMYLECEYVGEDLDKDPIKFMENVVSDFGLDLKNKDPRSWMEICGKA